MTQETPDFIAIRGFTYRDEGLVKGKYRSVFTRYDGVEFINDCGTKELRERYASDVEFFDTIDPPNVSISMKELMVDNTEVKICLDCGKEKTRYEVKIKTTIREFWQCWPCYDKRS